MSPDVPAASPAAQATAVADVADDASRATGGAPDSPAFELVPQPRGDRAAAKKRHPVLRTLGAAILVVVLCVTAALTWVQYSQRGHTVAAAEAQPAPVAIVLGASVWSGNRPSTYLLRRLQGALELYEAGDVQAILVSGAAKDAAHDEPKVMRSWLEEQGVPAQDIVEDRSGVDTHDSCVRAHDVYGVSQAIVVTQDYHLPRALFLCEHAGIDSQGVAVSSADGRIGWFQVREWGASLKAAYDVIFHRPPEHQDPATDELTKVLY